jgi:hypothetical protein
MRIAVFIAATIFTCMTPSLARAQNDCKTVFDADDKMLATDHHTYMTSAGVRTETTESITVAGIIYIQHKGAWRKSPITAKEMIEQKAENRKNAKNVSCHLLREEVVDGEATHVYSGHSETEDMKADVTVWISRSKGLPLKQEQDTDLGAGGKSHFSIRYSYSGVSAPPVQ